ncbi:Ribonuclease H domain [Macleaya cordata]|uniref:Ribonuclease H domain n=1 Tax=Macleaya cordata TaxID=56857 RepID=A0A200QLE9_MACCD|nr:Ribonuclease H domain [Macleaya cordata]
MWGNSVMNSLFHVSSAAVLSRTSQFIRRSSLLGFSDYVSSPWKRRINNHAGIKAVNLDTMLMRFRAQCYSTARQGRQSSKKSLKSDPEPSLVQEEKDAFYVVRKGGIIGVYKSLTDCQAQVGTSVCDPSVSVFKGYSLPMETEEYLSSRGLQSAIYTVSAVDVKEDLFGELEPCPFQQPPSSKAKTSDEASPPKRSPEVLESSSNAEASGATFLSIDALIKRNELDHPVKEQVIPSESDSCILEFDGASKGNPGVAGAGAVLRTEDGRLLCRLREGLGTATNNVAEYRAILLGLKHALKKGYKRISLQGDSKLVCMQVQGRWKTRSDNLTALSKEAKQLKKKFLSFQIRHVLRV